MEIQDVLKLMSPGRFLPDLAATDKAGVLAEMVDALVADTPLRHKDTILEMLKSREALSSTAVGPGVAFPHGRTLAVQELFIVVGRSRQGVDFDSVDGQPTHLFFMLIAPPQDAGSQYLHSLAVLTELMQDDDILARLLEADDYDSFCQVLLEAAS